MSEHQETTNPRIKTEFLRAIVLRDPLSGRNFSIKRSSASGAPPKTLLQMVTEDGNKTFTLPNARAIRDPYCPEVASRLMAAYEVEYGARALEDEIRKLDSGTLQPNTNEHLVEAIVTEYKNRIAKDTKPITPVPSKTLQGMMVDHTRLDEYRQDARDQSGSDEWNPRGFVTTGTHSAVQEEPVKQVAQTSVPKPSTTLQGWTAPKREVQLRVARTQVGSAAMDLSRKIAQKRAEQAKPTQAQPSYTPRTQPSVQPPKQVDEHEGYGPLPPSAHIPTPPPLPAVQKTKESPVADFFKPAFEKPAQEPRQEESPFPRVIPRHTTLDDLTTPDPGNSVKRIKVSTVVRALEDVENIPQQPEPKKQWWKQARENVTQKATSALSSAANFYQRHKRKGALLGASALSMLTTTFNPYTPPETPQDPAPIVATYTAEQVTHQAQSLAEQLSANREVKQELVTSFANRYEQKRVNALERKEELRSPVFVYQQSAQAHNSQSPEKTITDLRRLSQGDQEITAYVMQSTTGTQAANEWVAQQREVRAYELASQAGIDENRVTVVRVYENQFFGESPSDNQLIAFTTAQRTPLTHQARQYNSLDQTNTPSLDELEQGWQEIEDMLAQR